MSPHDPQMQFVLKVAARCNLNCSYCYIYNKGDETWRDRPALMSDAVFTAALDRIARYCERSGQRAVSITFHGGEPCLMGAERFDLWCAAITEALGERMAVELCLQTNGTLIDPSWVEVLRRWRVSVGVSLDGPPPIHDRYRLDHSGRGSHAQVVRGLALLREAEIPVQILSVIQFGSDGLATHRHLLELGASTINYLLPDFNHDTIGDIRARFGPTPCADVLIPIFEQWWRAGEGRPRVSLFLQMIQVIFGGESDVDLLGNHPMRFLFVETDGGIEVLDVLRTCVPGMTATGLDVMQHDFTELRALGELHEQIIFSGPALPSGCVDCRERLTCAGGYLPHRYSQARGFDNPSVWCADMLKLFDHVRERIAAHSDGVAAKHEPSAVDLVHAVAWSDAGEVAGRVHQQYVDLLVAALERTIAALRGRDSELAAELVGSLLGLSDRRLLRVLTAPEVSYRLLWPCEPSEAARFICMAGLAERALAGEPVQLEQPCWTALGDACMRPDGRRSGYLPARAGLVLDMGSPHVHNVDFGGPGNHRGEPRELFSAEEIRDIQADLDLALAGIEHTSPALLEFVLCFNKVLICQKDPAAPEMFSSGSTGQYAGRSFVTNPQLPEVDALALAESLVHEGIHGLLYMDERLRPWMSSPEADATTPSITSPWSGNRLSPRSYVQACFVWYGLANFWARALVRGVWSDERVRPRLARCVVGFTRGPLTARLDALAGGVRADLLDAIALMQAEIIETISETSSETETRSKDMQDLKEHKHFFSPVDQ